MVEGNEGKHVGSFYSFLYTILPRNKMMTQRRKAGLPSLLLYGLDVLPTGIREKVSVFSGGNLKQTT